MFDSIKAARSFTYAEDTKLMMVIDNSFNNNLLQEDLNEVSLWSASWDLSLNSAKYCHVHYHFSRISCDNEYLINMDPVSSTHQIKDLGHYVIF